MDNTLGEEFHPDDATRLPPTGAGKGLPKPVLPRLHLRHRPEGGSDHVSGSHDRSYHDSAYVDPPPIHSSGRAQYNTFATDALAPTPRSPPQPRHVSHQAGSDAASDLNAQMQRSHIDNARKRTADVTSQADSRPTKQAALSPPSQYTNSPSQSHAPYWQSSAQESVSPTQAHRHSKTHVAYDPQCQSKTSPPSSPTHNGPSDPTVIDSPETLLKQPATRPITEPQLINEVKGIYAGLVMVERKCVDIIDQQNSSNKRLSDQQWKALVALHRTLLQEHHDFFSASQHPTASENLKKLAVKYVMPARMWRHGIHAFLELLRHRLPDSMEHMLSFIYLAYSMMALLKESVPSFVETWIECLGDLARYRMAIEDTDARDRDIWSNVAKMWYNEAADKSPNVGRIQHHLAVLARPNIVEQLFYYGKALVTVVPFTNARESIMLLFDMFLKNNEAVQSRYPPAEFAFVHYYALLFTRQRPSECRRMLDLFGSTFGSHMDRSGARFKMQGPEMASALFAGLLDFGSQESFLWKCYDQELKEVEALQKGSEGQPVDPAVTVKETASLKQRQTRESTGLNSPVEKFSSPAKVFKQEVMSRSEDAVALAAQMVMETISLVSSRMGDKNIVPFMHVVLANLWDLSQVAGALVYVQEFVPWNSIALFLNTLGKSGVSLDNVESDAFPPSHGGSGRQLPEDFIMRGMRMTRHYYKPGFFAPEVLVDEDERTIELPSHQGPRAERCLWLGRQLSKLGQHLTYNIDTKHFEATEFAKSLATQHVEVRDCRPGE